MFWIDRLLGPKISNLIAVVGVFALTFLSLWPLRYINPIADDLHLLTQGVGLMRTQGVLWVLNEWSEFSLSSSHITPLGGVWSTLHIWILDFVTSYTPLTIGTVWGFLRITWIAVAVVSAYLFMRTVVRTLHLPATTPLVGLAVLLATIQVHGYWSNDPVTAFPIASWAFCIIGFLFLSSLVQANHSNSLRSKHLLFATSLAIIGVLTYELFIAFLLAGAVFLILQWIVRGSSFRLIVFSALPAIAIPSLFLLVTQYLRLSQGSSYSGTDIALSSSSLPKTGLVALLSSLPLTNLPLTQKLLQNATAPTSYMLPLFTVLLLLLVGVIGLHLRNQGTKVVLPRPYQFMPVIGAMLTVWVIATAVIVATPKYQSELAGELGKVYVNFAPSWLALGVLFTTLSAYLLNSLPKLGLIVFSVLILVVGSTQTITNTKQISTLARDSSWSTSLLELLDSDINAAEQRCGQFSRLFGLPFPEYYQLEIFEGLQMAHEGRNGIPYCNFDSETRPTPSLTRSLAGTFPVEFLPNDRKIFWSNDAASSLQVYYLGSSPFSGDASITVLLPSCATQAVIAVKINEFSEKKIAVAGEELNFVFPVSAKYGDSFAVEFQMGHTGCSVLNDPRTFFGMISEPILLRNQN
jgi:hypothetical protein